MSWFALWKAYFITIKGQSQHNPWHVLIWSRSTTSEAFSSLLVPLVTCFAFSVQNVSGFAIKKKSFGWMVHHRCGGLTTHPPSVEPTASLKTQTENVVRNKQARCKSKQVARSSGVHLKPKCMWKVEGVKDMIILETNHTELCTILIFIFIYTYIVQGRKGCNK